jgi:ABC-type polysaccharide/polyol phosphate transport system ATPase subunit
MTTAIEINNVSLKFRTYSNPTPTLKEWTVHLLTRKNQGTYAKNEFFALRDFNLKIEAGQRLGVIGLNGAGKSTLLKVMVGIYTPTEGSISVNGRVTPMIELGTGFDIELSGRENIYVNGALLGFSRQVMKKREQEIIAFSELGDFIDTPVKYYSSGMYGRLVFSIATMVEPEILLIDEIFSAGDAHFVKKATERMTSLFKNSQIVVFVSHSLEQIRALCDRVIVLDKGQIAYDGNGTKAINYYMEEIVNRL